MLPAKLCKTKQIRLGVLIGSIVAYLLLFGTILMMT